MTTILKWLTFYPIAVFSGIFTGGLILWGGNYLVGNWAIPSGFVIYVGSAMIPCMWVMVGLMVAPEKNRWVKWALLSPLLLLSIFQAVGLIFLVWGRYQPEDHLSWESLSHSLSTYWQMILFGAGFIVGTLFIASKSPREIVE